VSFLDILKSWIGAEIEEPIILRNMKSFFDDSNNLTIFSHSKSDLMYLDSRGGYE